ncbi:hypothetical protein COO60DRAFT_865704 [Scenedesmus sp. NREL 46B-D3]|nr:hypothetical protein COO60DRAFT_865704 [Scenedesmus sp. NREL 46B-D3]
MVFMFVSMLTGTRLNSPSKAQHCWQTLLTVLSSTVRPSICEHSCSLLNFALTTAGSDFSCCVGLVCAFWLCEHRCSTQEQQGRDPELELLHHVCIALRLGVTGRCKCTPP